MAVKPPKEAEVPKLLTNVKVIGSMADYMRQALIELANLDDRKNVEGDNILLVTVDADKKMDEKTYVEFAKGAQQWIKGGKRAFIYIKPNDTITSESVTTYFMSLNLPVYNEVATLFNDYRRDIRGV